MSAIVKEVTPRPSAVKQRKTPPPLVDSIKMSRYGAKSIKPGDMLRSREGSEAFEQLKAVKLGRKPAANS